MADWSRRDEPTALPNGSLRSRLPAGRYITKLPNAEHEAPEWQAAMTALMLIAERDGPTMLAWIHVD